MILLEKNRTLIHPCLQSTMRVETAFSNEQTRFIIIQYSRVESPTDVKRVFGTEYGIEGRVSTLHQPKVSCDFGKSFRYTHCLLQHPETKKTHLQ